MKKFLKTLLIMVLLYPTIVLAGGGSDDDSMSGSHMNINCVYEDKTIRSTTLDSGRYVGFEFVGINAIAPGTTFTYRFGKISTDGKFEKNYEYTFASGCDTCGRWLNFNKGYGSEYWLQAWWLNQTMDDKANTLSGSEIQAKADNGDFCPAQILITQLEKGSHYYFVSCRDDADCDKSESKLFNEHKYINTKTVYFTGTTLAISNINQDSYDETNAEEKVEEGKQNVEKYCDKNSSSYDEKKCAESKIVSNATEDTASNIVTYNPKVDTQDFGLSTITCETIFLDNGKYNSTYKLLNSVFKFIQYLGIVLASVLSIVDFIKVVPTQDKDVLKKATNKSLIRLMIAILLFFVPIILNLILQLIGFNSPMCGLFK